ncbi:hypothetical protein D9757_010326 [Collybiopsis confluens]|uniref:Glucose-methanol-choline oxidoreductase N-terminal domain-containing protein n=1 Tax=Collybiopsis confluens TaxID=2823264 RepID=A0A8H5GMQ9_9AGAR|nr:hypothetical protein D9757_010326 [Collybiopsis confluens]
MSWMRCAALTFFWRLCCERSLQKKLVTKKHLKALAGNCCRPEKVFPYLFSTPMQKASSKSYTYIIVGGGTAGCVLASRLSEDPKFSVLLIERGPVVSSWTAHVPLLSSNFNGQKAPVYKWQSAPLTAVGGKTLTMVTGKALGGSSKINGLLYTRSVPGEYNAWERAGRKGWGWSHVEPFFNKSETSLSSPKANYRGKAGPWKTQSVDNIRFKAVSRNVEIAPSFGIPHILEANDPASPVVSCTLLDATIDQSGHREATSDAFLPKHIQGRKNLSILTGTLVTAVDIQGHKAVGVYLELDKDSASSSRRVHVSAEREIILCAGAIATPQILLLSGVGPVDHLKQHNIPVMKDLPGVGAHLQDHISVPLIYQVPVTDSIAILMANPLSAVANMVLRSSLLDSNSRIVIAEREQDLDGYSPSNIPDIEVMLIPVNPTDRSFDGLSKNSGTFSYLCTVLRPESTGSVRLSSQNARDQPLCDLGILSNPSDRIPLRKVLRLALALGRSMRDGGYPLEDLLVPTSESDDDLDTFADENLTTTYHYSSSCRMAPEADLGVVDDELRVHGIAGLRIADASIFPHVPACHLQAPVVMVAERCAEFLTRGTVI